MNIRKLIVTFLISRFIKNENTGEYEDDPCFRVPGYTVGWVVMDHTNGIIKGSSL